MTATISTVRIALAFREAEMLLDRGAFPLSRVFNTKCYQRMRCFSPVLDRAIKHCNKMCA